MDLSFPSDLRGFADDVRSFVRAELPVAMREKVKLNRSDFGEDRLVWQRKLVAKGWAAPTWPVVYGGTNWDVLKRYVFSEVMADEYAPAPIPFGQTMLAPVLLQFGTEEQRQHYLPRILTLEYFFCQGFSEPGAGSDLASLKTSAVQDGDYWVINGQKTWTSAAHHANMIFCLVRTDPQAKKPQEGISMLIFPLDLPGITIRPIITLDHDRHVNETFFDNVRVHKSCMIGEPNLGWTYAKALLGFERHEIARIGLCKRWLRQLKETAATTMRGGTPIGEHAYFKTKIAKAEIDLKALEMLNLRMLSNMQRNLPGNEANMLKIRGSELQQTMTELRLEIGGANSLRYEREGLEVPEIFDDVDYRGDVAATYFMNRVVTIYGGSNEIQRNVLAKSFLEL